MKSRIPVFQSSMSRRKIEKIRLLGENLEPCRHSLAPSTLSIALTVKQTYVTQVYELRARGRAEKQISGLEFSSRSWVKENKS